MGMLELLVMRLVLWIGLPLLLFTLAIGPLRLLRQVKFGWKWLTRRRLDPEEILTNVLRQHQEHVAGLRRLLEQEETAEAAIVANLKQSEGNLSDLEQQARRLCDQGDELGARAAVYKLNLERAAMENFRGQHARQRELIEDSRRRLYQLELQLRQYEVGRSILLSQLAAAEKVEQQYAIARQFDPFNAVANWEQAEGLVQQKELNAKAIERVYIDTADMAHGGRSSPVMIDPLALETELARLRGLSNGPAPSAISASAADSVTSADAPEKAIAQGNRRSPETH